MTRILLVRCAWHELISKALGGRIDACGLLPQGRLQATNIAATLEKLGVSRLQTSPRRRARETAEPSAARLGLELEVVSALDDMDFGEWTGVSLLELERDPAWCAWNGDRESNCPPGGETIQSVHARIMAHLAQTFRTHSNETVAMFTHVEIIRAVLLDERNLPLNQFRQIDVEPGGMFELGADGTAQHFLAVA